MSSAYRFDDHFFHDVSVPLTTLKLNLEILSQEKAIQNKQVVKRAIIGFNQLDGLINMHKNIGDRAGIFNYKNAINECLDLLYIQISLLNIQVEKSFVGNLNIKGSAKNFKRIFLNIIKNSIEALEHEKFPRKIAISGKVGLKKLYIRITDNGGGFPKNVLDAFNDPNSLITTKTKGSGIGLKNVKGIMEKEFNGRGLIGNNRSGGAFVELQFPLFD